jgi:hypothetical protein
MIHNGLDTLRRRPDGLARWVLLSLMSVALLRVWLGNLTMVGLAQGETKVRLNPPTSEVQVGDTVSVDIVIEDVADLYGLDLRLSFDPALLEVQDADPGTAGVQIQKGTFPAPDFVVKNEADNGAGMVWYAVSQRQDLHPDPVSGSGIGGSITFKGLAGGTSSVAFTYQKIVKVDGERIPATTRDGQVTVVLAGAAPASTSTPKPEATATQGATETPQPTPTSRPPTTAPPTEAPTSAPSKATPTSRPTSAPTPTAVFEATEMPQPTPTSRPPITAPPTEAPTSAPPKATPTSRPTSAPTPTAVFEATEVPLPAPTSTSVPAPTAQPEVAEEGAPSSTPLPTVTVSPPGTSGTSASDFLYFAVSLLGATAVAAILAMRMRNR